MPRPNRPDTLEAFPTPPRFAEPTAFPEPGAKTFAWGVWAMMTFGAIAFVAHYRTDVPTWDDYHMVPAVVGAQQVTPEWLWEQTNEHRIPVPKLALVAFGRAAGGDIRVGMFLSVAAMSALAAAMIALVGRMGDGPRASDAFFPVLLLHPGHAANFLWSFQITPLLPTALATFFLIPIAGQRSWPGPRIAAVAGVGLAILPLCGGNGVVFVPPLALWLIAAATAEFKSGRTRRGAMITMATLPGLALTAAYFRGFHPVLHPEPPGGALDGLRTAVQFLAVGVGEPAAWAWPWSGVATIGLLGLAVAWVVRAGATRPWERPRAVGLAAFLAGVAALALAVGWGRGWASDRAGFADRYIAMADPAWCWLAVAVRLYAPPALGRIVANVLFALVCVLAWPNAEVGLRHALERKAQAEALARDVRDGLAPFQIVRRHTPYLHPNQNEAARLLPILRKARVGPFGALADDPPFREVPLPLNPVTLQMVRWEGFTAHATGVDPLITFALASPRYVAGIRIKYSHTNAQGAPARFQISWKGPGEAYNDDRRHANWNFPTGNNKEATIWVDGVIDRFRIQPDNQPCDFQVAEITLLEPAQ
ncbi:hypothetical protein V5E97_27915 [Singulisphaera sp. Ch08]|uniref:Glycosyltransferase RgtA/B/C/D-like domain-containing protein n=1 Tax=Singulisphaera sp. Ch08 TaxID=3120278 RepID=A0AAU7CAZ6_9BACT